MHSAEWQQAKSLKKCKLVHTSMYHTDIFTSHPASVNQNYCIDSNNFLYNVFYSPPHNFSKIYEIHQRLIHKLSDRFSSMNSNLVLSKSRRRGAKLTLEWNSLVYFNYSKTMSSSQQSMLSSNHVAFFFAMNNCLANRQHTQKFRLLSAELSRKTLALYF